MIDDYLRKKISEAKTQPCGTEFLMFLEVSDIFLAYLLTLLRVMGVCSLL